MNIFNCQEAFGASDKTTQAMGQAIREWFELYYRSTPEQGEDPCQRIAYTAVSKVVRTAFGEYGTAAEEPFVRQVLDALNGKKETAMQLALVGGEVYLKPCIQGRVFSCTLIPRDHILIFARDPEGRPTDVGTMERSTRGSCYYTLLERRTVDSQGFLTIQNRLFSSYDAGSLGRQVALTEHPAYADLPDSYTYELALGSVGLVQMRTPMLNCVDGSMEGVSLYAPAVGLIHAIDRNEYQLKEEFERGESRVFASSDLLREGALTDHLFVGLDEDPERVGMTVYSPQLRESSFLNRKQEYLRNVESVIGLKRGLLSDANVEDRTATEIASSEGEHALTVLDFQRMWEKALQDAVALWALLGRLYGLPGAKQGTFSVDWGNGTLFDEDQLWEDYKDLVSKGLIKPEIALGWRFNLPADTPEQQKAIRQRYMPEES